MDVNFYIKESIIRARIPWGLIRRHSRCPASSSWNLKNFKKEMIMIMSIHDVFCPFYNHAQSLPYSVKCDRLQNRMINISLSFQISSQEITSLVIKCWTTTELSDCCLVSMGKVIVLSCHNWCRSISVNDFQGYAAPFDCAVGTWRHVQRYCLSLRSSRQSGCKSLQ